MAAPDLKMVVLPRAAAAAAQALQEPEHLVILQAMAVPDSNLVNLLPSVAARVVGSLVVEQVDLHVFPVYMEQLAMVVAEQAALRQLQIQAVAVAEMVVP